MRPPEHWYMPGTSVRFSTKNAVLGSPTDTPAITLTLRFKDGSEITDPAPVRDATGQYHSDQVIPTTAAPGVAVARWQSTGVQPAQNVLEEKPFGVKELSF